MWLDLPHMRPRLCNTAPSVGNSVRFFAAPAPFTAIFTFFLFSWKSHDSWENFTRSFHEILFHRIVIIGILRSPVPFCPCGDDNQLITLGEIFILFKSNFSFRQWSAPVVNICAIWHCRRSSISPIRVLRIMERRQLEQSCSISWKRWNCGPFPVSGCPLRSSANYWLRAVPSRTCSSADAKPFPIPLSPANSGR